MVTYIDGHKDRFGVEPICAVLPIAPSTYYAHKVLQRAPDRRSDRAKRDAWLKGEIERVWEDNYRVYGVRKVWRQLKREGVAVARCTVARLMHELGLQGVVRGRRIKTTLPDETSERPLDRVQRDFTVWRPSSAWAKKADAVRNISLERENRELKRANEILRTASAFFAQAELDRRLK